MVTYGETPAGPQKSRQHGVSFNHFQNIPDINSQRYRGQGEARETLKAAMKNRPPVAEIVKEITKVVQLKLVLE